MDATRDITRLRKGKAFKSPYLCGKQYARCTHRRLNGRLQWTRPDKQHVYENRTRRTARFSGYDQNKKHTKIMRLGARVVPFGTVLDSRAILRRNVNRFRGRLVLEAHRPLYHSILGSSVVKKKKKTRAESSFRVSGFGIRVSGFKIRGSGFESKVWCLVCGF